MKYKDQKSSFFHDGDEVILLGPEEREKPSFRGGWMENGMSKLVGTTATVKLTGSATVVRITTPEGYSWVWDARFLELANITSELQESLQMDNVTFMNMLNA